MYVCGSCGSTEHIEAYFPALVKRGWNAQTSWWERGGAYEEENTPVRMECYNCYARTDSPDDWFEDNAKRAFICEECGYAGAAEEYGYCDECKEGME